MLIILTAHWYACCAATRQPERKHSVVGANNVSRTVRCSRHAGLSEDSHSLLACGGRTGMQCQYCNATCVGGIATAGLVIGMMLG